MNHAFHGVANTTQQANAIVERLQSTGFMTDDISVLFPDKAGTRDFAHEKNTKAPEGAAGPGVGGALGCWPESEPWRFPAWVLSLLLFRRDSGGGLWALTYNGYRYSSARWRAAC
jgi:hypothetical protein